MPLLALDRVTKRYWRGAREVRALDEVTLALEPGECVAVWGRRGSGRSTLVKIAAGILPPDDGRVTFDGVDLSRCSRSALAQVLRERIGVVQRSRPIPVLSALDYVALPLLGSIGRTEAHRRAAQALNRVGVVEGVELRWEELSDGDQALVGLAHAIVRQPALLVADDPAAGLDAIEGERLVGILRAAAEEGGMAVLLTTPDAPHMMRSDNLMSLTRGRLITTQRDPAPVIDFPRKRPTSNG